MRWLIPFFFPFLAMGETLFVTQAGAGSATGADLANAWSMATLNTPGNWGAGAGKVSAGDTVSLNGTLTTALTVQGSGVAGNPITILFASGAKLSAATWTTSGAIQVGEHNFIKVDGGANGLIECTANGTSLANKVNAYGVVGTSANNLTVQNLTINNLYARTRGGEQNQYGIGVSDECTGATLGFGSLMVSNCIISNAYIGVDTDYSTAGVTNIEICYNSISNVNWGARCGDRTSGATCDNWKFHHNTVSSFTNWDDTVSDNMHHNACYVWAESGGFFTNGTFYANRVDGPYSSGSPNHSTSAFFASGAGMKGPLLYYNNLTTAASGDAPADGFFAILPEGATVTAKILNNTVIGGSAGIGLYVNGGTATIHCTNNIFQAVTAISIFNSAGVTLTSDNNVGFNLISGQEYSTSTTGSSSFKTLAQWQALGFDGHSSSLTPNLSVNYIPTATSSALDTGAALTSLFTTDKNDATRPQGSAWDIGAFEFLVGGPPVLSGGPISGGTIRTQ